MSFDQRSIASGASDVFEVEDIVDMREDQGVTEYRVRWKSYGADWDTWEPMENLMACQDLVDAFISRMQAESVSVRYAEAIHKPAIKRLKLAEDDDQRKLGDAGSTYTSDVSLSVKMEGPEPLPVLSTDNDTLVYVTSRPASDVSAASRPEQRHAELAAAGVAKISVSSSPPPHSAEPAADPPSQPAEEEQTPSPSPPRGRGRGRGRPRGRGRSRGGGWRNAASLVSESPARSESSVNSAADNRQSSVNLSSDLEQSPLRANSRQTRSATSPAGGATRDDSSDGGDSPVGARRSSNQRPSIGESDLSTSEDENEENEEEELSPPPKRAARGRRGRGGKRQAAPTRAPQPPSPKKPTNRRGVSKRAAAKRASARLSGQADSIPNRDDDGGSGSGEEQDDDGSDEVELGVNESTRSVSQRSDKPTHEEIPSPAHAVQQPVDTPSQPGNSLPARPSTSTAPQQQQQPEPGPVSAAPPPVTMEASVEELSHAVKPHRRKVDSSGLPIPIDAELKVNDYMKYEMKVHQREEGRPLSDAEFADACMQGNLQNVRGALIASKKSGRRIDIDKVGPSGTTLLMSVAVRPCDLAHECDDILELLVQNGANVNFRNAHGDTPLLIAAEKGYLCKVSKLLSLGAAANLSNASGETPLTIVCRGGYAHVVHRLLDYGANFNVTNCSGLTPAQVAQACGNSQCGDLVLSHINKVKTVFDRELQTVLGGAVKLKRYLFPMHCYALNESNIFRVVFPFESFQFPRDRDYGFLLFVGLAKFGGHQVQARFWGPCPIQKVILNDVEQMPIQEEGKFVFSCWPLIDGDNVLLIECQPGKKSQMKLLIQAFLVQVRNYEPTDMLVLSQVHQQTMISANQFSDSPNTPGI